MRWLSAALALVMVLPPARPAAAQPALAEVLKRAAAYVSRFHAQLSQLAGDEHYIQVAHHTAQSYNPVLDTNTRVELRSDLLLVRPSNVDRYVEFRDVFEVDGKPVRDRKERLQSLWRAGSTDSSARLEAILAESARYNIGSIQRNINTPLMAMMFLDAKYQPRFRFKQARAASPVFGREHTPDQSGVFRVHAEMWAIEFEERAGNTIVRQPNGRDLRSRGRFWVNPDTGAVMVSELVIDGGGVLTKVTVSYQSEPLMGLLVPVEMRESYQRRNEVITGHAVYARFRLLDQQ
jgi:hypothetical protein